MDGEKELINGTRGSFLKKMAVTAGGVIGGWSSLESLGILKKETGITHYQTQKSSGLALPTPGQVNWQNSEVGILFEFDIRVAEKGSRDWKEVFNPGEYNPKNLDTDRWIEIARSARAKYAIFTATHFSGFLQWQSDLHPYGLKQAKWRNGKREFVGHKYIKTFEPIKIKAMHLRIKKSVRTPSI